MMACIQKEPSGFNRLSPIWGWVSCCSPFSPSLKLLEVEGEVLLAVGEVLDAQQLHSLLGSFQVVSIGMVHRQLLEGGLAGEEQTVAEGVLGVDAVAEDDVRYLEGQQRIPRLPAPAVHRRPWG